MLKEPEIKLFGRKISLPEHGVAFAGGELSGELSNESSNGSGDCDRCLEESRGHDGEVGREEKQEQTDEELAEGEVCDTIAENDDQNPSQNTNNAPKSPPNDDDEVSGTEAKSENEENGAANSEQKTLKKPDKILACPRCSSMDTKFCYYNNYNVNQPRHFCKSCQRYWTAGGTMRNVPVGAGRRKSKNSASPHCRHITISEALHDSPNSFRNLQFKPNTATVLSFGPDSFDSTPPALNPSDRNAADGGYKNGERSVVDDCSMPNPQQQPLVPGTNGYPCIPGVAWPFPCLPAIFPVPCYLWNLPWVTPGVDETTKTAATSPTSPLGKHSRSPNTDGDEGREERRRKSSIVVPKTLRIDDPEEAARSSIWSTLGIKYDSISSREGLLKAFQPKAGDAKKQAMAAANSSLLQANPAALSRSLKFQETA